MEVLSYITIFLNLVLLIINLKKHGIPLPFQNGMDEIPQNQVVDCRITDNYHLILQSKDDSIDELDKLKLELERLATIQKSVAVALKKEKEALKQERGVLMYEYELLKNRTSVLKNRLGACLKRMSKAR